MTRLSNLSHRSIGALWISRASPLLPYLLSSFCYQFSGELSRFYYICDKSNGFQMYCDIPFYYFEQTLTSIHQIMNIVKNIN